MKKIISIGGIAGAVFLGGALLVSAQYYGNYTPYYNTYQNTASSNSYVYTQGCYKYQYDAYTRVTSLIGSICTTNTNTNTNYNTCPTYQTYPYTYGCNNSTSQYYTYPTSQYYTYMYNNGSWYPANSYYPNNNYGGYGYNYNSYTNYTYNTGYTNTSNGCYWSGGYQVCY